MHEQYKQVDTFCQKLLSMISSMPDPAPPLEFLCDASNMIRVMMGGPDRRDAHACDHRSREHRRRFARIDHGSGAMGIVADQVGIIIFETRHSDDAHHWSVPHKVGMVRP